MPGKQTTPTPWLRSVLPAVALVLFVAFLAPLAAEEPGQAPQDKPAEKQAPEAEARAAEPGEGVCSPDPDRFNFNTLEDIYGDTGDTFQGGIGLYSFEKASPGSVDPLVGYGIGVDDVKFEWREFTLVGDATDCGATGACAVLSMSTTNLFEGNATIPVTLIDRSPSPNDCDGDGTPDVPTDFDCDDNGTPDVVIRFSSEAEIAGEILFANETSNPDEYVGLMPISSSYDAAGVLFVQPYGSDNPTVTAEYFDYDDGTGSVCDNAVVPANRGIVRTSLTVFLITGDLTVTDRITTDNGDADGIPDTSETVSLRIEVTNKTGFDMTGVTARLASNSPWIDCVLASSIAVGDIADGAALFSTETFVFRISDLADRQSLGLTDLDVLAAELNITLASDQVAASSVPQSITIDLDLDASGGGSPTTFFEGFEVPSGFGTFTTMNLDFGLHSYSATDGYRCQYNSPQWHASNSYGTPCMLGSSSAAADAFFWQVHQTTDIDGGRSFSGTRSLHFGLFGAAADEHTTPLAVLEAVRTQAPVALGFTGSAPELSFKHQISLMDSRTVVLPPGESTDRGVVFLQLADPAVVGPTSPAIGDWIKLQPFANVYDQQGTDGYTNCLFDPVDDGNDEYDFFDPQDPNRRLGPSSTCFPEFSFTHLGDTFHGSAFNPNSLGNAQGPGLCGGDAGGTGNPSCNGVGWGTWVESRFNLEQFRGRYVRFRFLATTLENGSTSTYQAAFQHNPDPGDDGWWIDDVTISNALTAPALLSIDTKDNSGLSGCGATCNTVSASLVADPPGTLPAPGQVVELDASGSSADRCVGGTLQFRFSDGLTTLRDWTDNPIYLDAPLTPTTYTVDVRCSSATLCFGSASQAVPVDYPSSGPGTVFQTILAPDKDSFEWGTPADVAWVRGYTVFLPIFAVNGGATVLGTDFIDISADAPPPGLGYYYLVKDQGPLGGTARGPAATTWSSGGASEQPGRDAQAPTDQCERATPDLWVVNSGTSSFSRIDSCNRIVLDTTTLVDDGTGYPPRSIDFSTADGQAGDYAFITQGPFVQVVNTSTRTANRVDVGALFGVCSVGDNPCIIGGSDCGGGADICVSRPVILKGIDAARLQTFNGTDRALLYIAADVTFTGPVSQPWYVVLDQETLISSSGQIVLQAGRLEVADGSEALDVTAIAEPDPLGPPSEYQRAWFTTRGGVAPNQTLTAVLLSTGDDLTTPARPWSRDPTPSVTPGLTVSDGIVVGAGRLGDRTVLPTSSGGTLVDLGTGSTLCNYGGTQRAAAIDGTGGGSYRIFAVDETNNVVRRIADDAADIPGTCVSATSFATGAGPVAIELSGFEAPTRAFVANRTGNSVSVIQDASTAAPISLPPASLPTDLAVQTVPETSCGVEITNITNGTLQWQTVGCATESPIFFVYCQCNEAAAGDCPRECPQVDPCPGCEDIGDSPWIPLGFTAGGVNSLSSNGIVTDPDVLYNVIYDERQNYTLSPP